MNRSLTLLIMTCALVAPGCKKKKKAPPPPVEIIDQGTADEVVDAGPKKVYVPEPPDITPPDYEEQRAYEKSLDQVEYDPDLHGGKGVPGYENKFDWDRTITATIARIDTTGKLWRTEDGPGDNVLWEAPTLSKHVTWTDRAGTNLLVYGKKDYEGGGALLTAEIAVREAGAWVVRRQFKDMVETCKADITLEPQVDPAWSIKDLDGDGFAEVTMVWTAGCSTDKTAPTHKVIVVSKDKKYALRGTLGAAYKADPAFEGSPAAFLTHATSVWEKTSKTMP